MKRLALLLSFIIFNPSFSQDNAKKCYESVENISKLIESKNFIQAEKDWIDLNKKCSNLTEQYYQNGEIILEQKKQNANTIDEKKAIVQNLIQLFNQYDQKFPVNKNANRTKKALYLSNYNFGTTTEIFEALDKDFKQDIANFKNPEALYLYFDSYLKIYQSNKKSISIDNLISKSIEIDQTIYNISSDLNQNIAVLVSKQKSETLSNLESSNLKKYTENSIALKNASTAIQTLINTYITCDNFNKYCNTKFESNQNNFFWLETVSEKLFAKNCFTDLILEKIVAKIYEINPSSKASFNLAYINFIKNNTEKAIFLFNEAADKVATGKEKGEIFYTIATVVFGLKNKKQSFEYLQKAIELDPNLAKAYLYQAQLIETSITECKMSEFEKKAIYWLLAKTVENAGIANKMYEKSSKTKAENYLKKAPTKSETKAAGFKENEKISFNCWFNQTIEIPKL